MKTLKRLLWLLGVIGVIALFLILLQLSLNDRMIIRNQKLIAQTQEEHSQKIDQIMKFEKEENLHEQLK